MKASVDYLRLLKREVSNLERKQQELEIENKRMLIRMQEMEQAQTMSSAATFGTPTQMGPEAPILWHPNAPSGPNACVDNNNNSRIELTGENHQSMDDINISFNDKVNGDGTRHEESPVSFNDTSGVMSVDRAEENDLERYDSIESTHGLVIKKERDSEIPSTITNHTL